ncbi:MAG: rhodanese-like domain-containing protein [Vicingaceae bacterium]|jgi:rhodanese-related sulfurtransferase
MKFVELDAAAFKSQIDSISNVCLIDVREEYEFGESNIGGNNIPMGEVLSNLSELKNRKSIYIICTSGNRSKAIAYHLSKKLDGCFIYSCIGGIQAFNELS